MLKEIETTIAEVELDDYTLKFEGILEETGWEVTMTPKNGLVSVKSWKISDADCWDADDVEEMVWGEVMRLTKKYSAVIFSNGITEIEEEDEEDN